MRLAFLLSAVIEIIGGFFVYFYPNLIFEAGHPFLKMYGIIAVILGILCLQCFIYFESNTFFKKVFLTLMGFHAVVAFACFSISPDAWPLQLYATLTHLGVFVFFVMGYLKDLKPDSEDQ